MPSVLAYWDIRGLAQPIRLLLKFVEEEFEDRLYSCGPAPGFKRDAWLNEKFSLGLDFPNLPYYIDGDVKVTQSNAILRHIGKKYNLCGGTDRESTRVDMMMEEAMDFRNGFVRLCYNLDFNNLKGDYLQQLPAKLKLYEAFLGDYPYFAGENLTMADFPMYEMLYAHTVMEPDILKDFPKLRSFNKRFEEIPQIKGYIESDNYLKRPFNNKMAVFK